MAKKKKNKSKKDDNEKSYGDLLKEELDTKGNIGKSLAETGLSFATGALGASAGWAIGRPSLLVGLATTFVGQYFDQPRLKSLGVALIASGGNETITKAVSGTGVDGLDGAKDRIKAFGENLKHRLYLDKIIKPATQGTSGLGEVQQFKYPANTDNKELDMGSLNDIENEIARSSEQFEQRQMNGSGEDDLLGVEDERIY